MNVGELLRERDRLLSVIEEAKTARSKLLQLNRVITMYGDDEKVTLLPVTGDMVTCGKCGEDFKRRGIGVHNANAHGGKVKVAS